MTNLSPSTRPQSVGEVLYQASSGRQFTDVESLEREYDVDGSAPDLPVIIAELTEHTRRARAELAATLGVAYGPTVDERLDVFPGHPSGPVVVFIHGGYWRSMAAEDFSCVASGLTRAGATVVITNYALCPAVTIDEIVRQHRAAVAWTYRNIADYGGDPQRIAVVGQSAGGHGVAMLLLTRWAENYGLPPDVIKGACAMSGLFDLRPLPYVSQQRQLRLTADTVLRNSPIFTPPAQSAPLLVTYGEEQTDEFIRQSVDFESAWRGAGLPCELWPRPGCTHFDELFAFTDAEAELTRRGIALADGRLHR